MIGAVMRLRVCARRGRAWRLPLFAGLVFLVAGCGSGNRVQDLGPAYPSDSAETPPAESTASPAAPGETITISLTGPPSFARTSGAEVVVSGRWGNQPGEFAVGEGTPREGPTEFALSSDLKYIAVLDWANSRIQLFHGGGDAARNLARTLRLPDPRGISDLAFSPAGDLLLLRGGQTPTLEILSPESGDTLNSLAVTPKASPGRVVANGPEVWVVGDDNLSFPIANDGAPIAIDTQEAQVRRGMPAGDDFIDAYRSDGEPSISVVSPPGSVLRVRITSPDLPLDSVRILGRDARGDTFAGVRIYSPGWQGTESWYFFALSGEGVQQGQVRLPLDNWTASGAYELGADGQVYELHSTKERLEILRNPLVSVAP